MDEIEMFLEKIRIAVREVGNEYINIPTTYKNTGIYRERVFCYEFYHQMRIIFNGNQDILIHGEIDKSGHTGFENNHRKNPDFVFHYPGNFNDNKVVLEVKGVLSKGIMKDLDTLLLFTQKYSYQVGIFLLYNYSSLELRSKYSRLLNEYSLMEGADKVYIVCLPNAGNAEPAFSLRSLSQTN